MTVSDGVAAVGRCGGCGTRIEMSRQGTHVGELPLGVDPTLAGERIGPYLLETLLGTGGMSAVYRARHTGDGRTVAVKVLSSAFARDPDFASRLRLEAGALRRIDHPHIIRVLDQGEDRGHAYVVLEFHEGRNLREVLQGGPLPYAQAMGVFIDTCAALAHAHRMGVVHRDIKPANLLVTPGGVQVLDFGIARLVHEDAPVDLATRLTRTSAVLGTVQYMAPEQLRDPRAADHRADLFGLGVVLYEMLTGSVPMGSFSPPSELAPGVPRSADALVARLLRPRPEDRYPTADDALVEGRRVATAPAEVPRRARGTAVGAAAFASLMLGAGVLLAALGPGIAWAPGADRLPAASSADGPGPAGGLGGSRPRGPESVGAGRAAETGAPKGGTRDAAGSTPAPAAASGPDAGVAAVTGPRLIVGVEAAPSEGIASRLKGIATRLRAQGGPSGETPFARRLGGRTPVEPARARGTASPWGPLPAPVLAAPGGTAAPATDPAPAPAVPDVQIAVVTPPSPPASEEDPAPPRPRLGMAEWTLRWLPGDPGRRPLDSAPAGPGLGERLKLSLKAWTDTYGNQWRSPTYEGQGLKSAEAALEQAATARIGIEGNRVIPGAAPEQRPGSVPDKDSLKLAAPEGADGER